MPRTDFARMRCPVARAMAILGERWTILILREAFCGTTRFDGFERSLGIAPNILSARLRALVRHGLLAREPAGGRHAYRLTERGRDAFPLYLAIRDWGARHLSGPEGPPTLMVDGATGATVRAPEPRRADGTPIRPEDVRILPGPGANEAIRRRFGARAGTVPAGCAGDATDAGDAVAAGAPPAGVPPPDASARAPRRAAPRPKPPGGRGARGKDAAHG
jgi:DNA-binding HxlR family transcriptional regulator